VGPEAGTEGEVWSVTSGKLNAVACCNLKHDDGRFDRR
jgi:hypothetical protein